MAKTIYFDCFSGASGDMVLGALLDLGLPLDALRGALGSLAIEYGEVDAKRVLRAGVSSMKFQVHEWEPAPPSGAHVAHAHPHAHAHHHSLKEVAAYIGRSALSPEGKDRATHLFERLARAEADIHAIPVEQVHLHEVGAVDSIIDIVGAVFGMEWLHADRIVASPMNVGRGMVKCAHGTFPVPAPATAALLAGVPIYAGEIEAELVTPTGALLVTGYASEFGPLPSMRLEKTGYGAGDRDFKGVPNVLRLMVGEASGGNAVERIVSIECEIDDMNPQLFGPLMERLYAAGALEVFYAAVQMKKNRPGTLVTVLARPTDRDTISGVLFAETTTIGVRHQEMLRERLEREVRSLETPAGRIRFKLARRDGRVVNVAPEFEDCARAAAERGLAIKDVQAIAVKAWLDSGGTA
ncbi:MAG: nickel pincer cofactor biosynthesis protein LarC [Acidobacteria bacterium]|nr:nickel pincer cofactor biosynthesis protein LarC [Acidobacteriota bacterium]MCA1651193.1 nickel pincer cofactor biosynthesis protein LarC [Acidobacteriota bacterium]